MIRLKRQSENAIRASAICIVDLVNIFNQRFPSLSLSDRVTRRKIVNLHDKSGYLVKGRRNNVRTRGYEVDFVRDM